MSNQGIKQGRLTSVESGTKARAGATPLPQRSQEPRSRPRAKGTQPYAPTAETEAALRSVLNASPHGMALLDPAGMIVLANLQFSQLVGSAEGPLPASLPFAEALDREAIEVELKSGRTARMTARSIDAPRGTVVVLEDVTELKHAEERLAHLATTDDLTGLPNHRALRSRLQTLWAEAERGRSFAVIFADVDHFKHINDRYGHTVGNEVLAEIASALRGQVRETDMMARFGGEEFCALLVDIDESQAMALAERLRAAVAAIRFAEPITASFGVCAYAADTAHPQALIRAADDALLRAKADGRNRVVGYHS